jgi:hypothetical protein
MRNRILKTGGWILVVSGFLTVSAVSVNMGIQFLYATVVFWVIGFGMLQINHRINKATALRDLIRRSGKRGIQTEA